MLGGAFGVIVGPTLWAEAAGHVQVSSIQQGQFVRHYRVYRPAAVQGRPGLVIALHGAQGNGLQMERGSGLDAQADRLGWIVSYPDGFEDGWEPFGCCHHPGVDDVAFISSIIDRLTASDGVDPSRVYATGISRGGMMAYRLACELASRLAAIAPVAGNMADSRGNVDAVKCRPSHPVSILAIHGSADPEVPIEGGRSRLYSEEVEYAPLTAVIGKWRELDACTSPALVSASGPSTISNWHCSGGVAIELVMVSGGGHTWPGTLIRNPPWGPDASVDASRLIADFFSANPRSAL
jgi:polyhydroxybutyrate depolymerase